MTDAANIAGDARIHGIPAAFEHLHPGVRGVVAARCNRVMRAARGVPDQPFRLALLLRPHGGNRDDEEGNDKDRAFHHNMIVVQWINRNHRNRPPNLIRLR